MLPRPLQITAENARRFMRRALLLDTPARDVATALAHHGYIQIDPINVCGRMHDLIAWNRVAGYREGDLMRHLHGDESAKLQTPNAELAAARTAFEHYLPGAAVLVALPNEAWPYLSGLIETRRLRRGVYARKLSPKAEGIARHIVSEIAQRGPLTSDDIEHEGRSLTGWGTPGRLVKNILEILLVHGRVLIARRRNFRRVYDLPERVLPASIRQVVRPEADAVARWVVLLKLRQRRLVTLKRNEVPLVEDQVQPVRVPDCPVLYCLREDVSLFDADYANVTAEADAVRLLAPLDPLIYDRAVTSRLWGFDYTWEVYTPPHKRARGYYALPVLAGTELVGHVDPKADRATRKLIVVSRRVRRGHPVTDSVKKLAAFLGLRPR